MNGGMTKYAETVEEKLIAHGVDGVTEKELMLLMITKLDSRLRYISPRYLIPGVLGVVAMLVGGKDVAVMLAETLKALLV